MIPCPLTQHPPDAVALSTTTQQLTYGELDSYVEGVRQYLSLKTDSRVAFVATPSLQTILLFFALFREGAIACPLSHRIPKEQIPTHLATLSATHFFAVDTLPLTPVRSNAPTLSLDHLATFLFTSGSSGTPKVACHTLGNHYYNALSLLSPLSLSRDSRWLLSLPLFHVSGIAILFRIFLSGGSVVLSDQTVADTLHTHEITHVSLVPTQLFRLLRDKVPMLQLQVLLLGGAPLPQSLLESALRQNLPLYTSFGMTEMSSLVTLATPEELSQISSSGKTMPLRELKIDETGEIFLKGKTLFAGYLDLKEQKIIEQNDWFATKDLGRLDADGSLHVIGRKDRQFISGGENIQPEEIEAALLQLPGISRATVLPVDDPEFGQRPVAFLEQETPTHTLDSLRTLLEKTLPSFKHPVQIFPYPEGLGMKPNLAALKATL